MERELYIGDGVYARHDGYQVLLRAQREEGWVEIALEPAVLGALNAFVRDVYHKAGVPMPADILNIRESGR